MAALADYREFVRLIRPVLSGYVQERLNRCGNDLGEVLSDQTDSRKVFRMEGEDGRCLRAAFLQLAWEEGRELPVPVSRLRRLLCAYQRSVKRVGETASQQGRRLSENLHKERRDINQAFATMGIPCHLELLRSSAAPNLLNENGVILELDPDAVALCRELTKLKNKRKSAGGHAAVTLGLQGVPGLATSIGQPLRISLRSELAGWLTLTLHFGGQTARLIPTPEGGPAKIGTRRKPYDLPGQVYPCHRWAVEPPEGRHCLTAIVSRTQQAVSLTHAEEVANDARLLRGVGIKPISIWDLPRGEIAVGYLAFDVLAADPNSDPASTPAGHP